MDEIMEYQQIQYDDTDVVDTLMDMFGDVISQDVIVAVVESCGGDPNKAAEAMMTLTSDLSTDIVEPVTNATNELNTPQTVQSNINTNDRNAPSTAINTPENVVTNIQATPQPMMSYASASQKTGVVPKQVKLPANPHLSSSSQHQPIGWSDQVRHILTHHNQGSRILVLMRGVPGSGKSYLARQIVEMTIGATYVDYKTHISSTDDYFMVGGRYMHNKSKLSDAHNWNQARVNKALRQGLSPIIIDNTNVEIWEMEPYAREAVRNGYIIQVVEPNTPWAKKSNQLVRRTTHNVPLTTIQRMLKNYEDGISGESLMKYYGMSYPAEMVPPVLRTFPEVTSLQENVLESTANRKVITTFNNLECANAGILNLNDQVKKTGNTQEEQTSHAIQVTSTNENQKHQVLSKNDNQSEKQTALNFTSTNQKQMIVYPVSQNKSKEIFATLETTLCNATLHEDVPTEYLEETARQKRCLEIKKQIEEFEKVEHEWENGENWENMSHETVNSGNGYEKQKSILIKDPKPPRKNNLVESTDTENFIERIQKIDDWRQISMFIPPWNETTSLQLDNRIELHVETKSAGTCVENGDSDLMSLKKTLKVITAIPRDINLFYNAACKEKIPERRMLDKSTMTNEALIKEAYRCKNEEQHFVAFRKMFKNVPRKELRDIFEKCCGDVNWAVEIVFDGMCKNRLQNLDDDDFSDTQEEENQELCNCMAAYNVVPDTESTTTTYTDHSNILQGPADSRVVSLSILPQKKARIAPSDTSVLLKRQMEENFVIGNNHYSDHCLKIKNRRHGENFTIDQNSPLQITDNASRDHNLPSTSKDDSYSSTNGESSNDEESTERIVNINLGKELLTQLDNDFERRGITYPKNVVPTISIPFSLWNEINTFWMESLMFQLDEHDRQNERMICEDEEFAKQLATKEAELVQQGREPEVPDFKEIMDLDFALSLYQKDVAEWRNKEPNDMAAKMTREKLYNLFPAMSSDTLSQVLMAHDNNFQATVETLLMSTGKTDILEEKNGLNKFVMKKEMERQEKLIEEEKKALSEVEWPLLPPGEEVDMSVVDGYRKDAEKHLLRRNMNYQKAQEYIRRGMTQIATYYSDIAAFHKQKYEQANSMAAISLVHVNASNNNDDATMDFHYLRVGEARESLDIFLDSHIQRLRNSPIRSQTQTLFLITGRGLHSPGLPRIKPAFKKRLKERGLVCRESNPGLLTVKVCAEDKLSYQVP